MVSSALHATARPGSTLSVRPPAGAFTYPSGDDRPLVLIGAGVGITPLISMLRHACAADPTRPVTLVYGARTERDFAFRDELHALSRRHPHVRMYFAASQGATQAHVYPGRIDEALLAAAAPDVAHVVACICGPGAMIDDTRSRLLARGMPTAQIRYERFEAAVAASTRAQDDAATAVGRPAAHAAHALTCARSGRQVAAQPGQTILEAAETAGVEIASLCRAGVCGTCRLQVTAGEAHCESTVLDDEDRAAGFVLACVTTLQSDCTVNA
jgi:ferredoxin-NADP reductase